MRTREESLKIISDAIGGNAYAANDISQNEQNTVSQQNTGMRSREESLRIIQSALGGGSTAEASPQPSSSQPTTPQSAAPTAPLTQGSLAGGAEQGTQALTAADYDRLKSEAETRLAELENEWRYKNRYTYEEKQAYIDEKNALEQQIEASKAGIWRLEREEKYGGLKNNADYETYASATEEKPTAGFGIGLGTSWWGKGDPVYDYINDIDGAREKWKNPSTMGHSPYSIYDYMDEDEIKTYNYLYNTDSKEAAGKYLDYIEYALNERSTKRIAQNAAEVADKHPVASSAASIPTNLVSGIGLADIAWQNLKREFTGEYVPIDYNRSTMAPSVMTSAIRGTVSQNIADSTGVINLDENEHPVLSKVFNGKSLGDVYQLGMSVADSLTVAHLTPFGKYGAVLLGGSAGTQGVLDALERGATDEQALRMGLLNGTFEALFEYASLDKLLTSEPRNLVMAMLRQGGVEASEEASTTLANDIADILVMAEKSDYELKIKAYMESGMSREKAEKQALLDKCIELGWDAVGGFFSGGLSGGFSAAVSGTSTHRTAPVQTETQAQTAGQEQTGAEAQVAEVADTVAIPQSALPTAPLTQGSQTPQSTTATAPTAGEPLRAATQGRPYSQPGQGPELNTRQEAQAQASEAAQDAQRATPQAETPPTTQNAAQAASDALNLRDEGNVSSTDYDTQRRESLMFSEAPQEAVHNTDSFDGVTANDDFQNRDFNDVGNQKIKAYMYENPEVKPFFQFEAEAMLNDLKNSVKGERFYNSQLAYDSGNEYGWTGNKRLVSDDIAVLLDYGYSYEEIEKGLKAIIEDDGRENNACSKRIEFLLNDRLMDGYTDWQSNEFVPPNQEYRNMILEKQINAYSKEAFEEYLKNAERYAPKDAKINSNGQSNPQGADAVRGFSENVATDSAMEEALRREFEQNPEMYTRLANKDTLKKAQDIFTQGLDKARSELERAIGAAQSGQKFPPEMVPLSRMVANELTRQGELTAARKIISDVAAELTSAGQLGQAGAILRNADPITVLNTLQKSIDAINAEVGKKFGKRNPWKAELTAEEIKQISETDFSQDGAFEAIQQQIAERLGREMPATLLEKLREIRKVGMLANPKTQIKNRWGNIPIKYERKMAEKLSGGMQELAVKAGIMAKEEQTRTLRVSQESKDLAKSVYKNNIDRITKTGNKGELRGILRDTRTYFNKGILQKGIEKATGHQLNDAALDYVRRFTYECLEKGDAPFVKSAFIDSLAQYCEAQGIKSEADVTETAYSYALDQAMAATFKDASALANLLNSIKDKAGIAGQALDVLFPFTTTPINIAKEFGKYSPLGYLQLLNAKGKGTAEVIDIISRATTGSAVVAIGAILRSLGFITGAADDDKDKAAADKAAGISPYSILGKYSYEWMQPTGSALAMGASIYDAAKDGGSLIETISNGIISAGDAYLEQSFYKDIIDLFKGYGSPTENMIKEVLTGTASQFIPTIVGATARTIDPTVRTSYSGGNIIDDILAQAKVKTPGLSKSAPASVNVRGEEIQRGNLAQRILDNFIFPWTTNRNGGEENAVDEAIDEVYAETGDKTIFRQISPYKVSYKNETYQMTGEEREQFQKTQGQVHDDIIQQIIDGTLWQEMDNDAKVKTMQLANEYALDAAKRELVESRGNEYSSDWDDEAELPDVGDYLAAKTTLKAAQDSKDYTLLDALVDTVSEQQKAVQEKLNKDFSMFDELIYGKQRGVDAETIYTAKTEADANGNGKISQEELWYYLGLQKNMPEETKDVLWDILTTGKTGYSQYAEKQK